MLSSKNDKTQRVIFRQYMSALNLRLLEACTLGDFAKASALLEQGADPDSQDEKGVSCLHKVAQIADGTKPISDLIDLLIKKGARIRHSALHCSASPAAVRSLLSAGADVNARTTDGNSALSSVLLLGREDIAVELLRNGASFDPLVLLKARTPALVRELLLRGADPNVVHVSSGVSSLQAAVDRGDRAVARVLLEFQADATKIVPRICSASERSSPAVESSVAPPGPQPTPPAPTACLPPAHEVASKTGGASDSLVLSVTGLLDFLGEFEKRLRPESFTTIELGAIEGALEVVLRKVRSLKN